MQKTTRLVARSRQLLLGVFTILCLATSWPAGSAAAQTQTQTGGEDQWGEKTPPENYVRSKEPSKSGHAYNWTQMAYAAGLMACMGGFVYWLIRRNQREPEA